MRDELKIIGFAAVVCIACSLILSAAYASLKGKQDYNKKIDQQFNVLKALGVEVQNEKGKKVMSNEEVSALFDQSVESLVLDENGVLLGGVKPEDLEPVTIAGRGATAKSRYPVYIFKDPKTSQTRYALHISGKGLWSTLKGYIALDAELEKIVGITFYEHGETPGLGAEVDQPWFQKQFPGKVLFTGNKQSTFQVMKPAAPEGAPSAVDSIPGATITSKGVQKFLNSDMAVYNKYLSDLRSR
ncbi:MAG: NADH:ubiquinone reductase (Na(+)-transporting) subunit C [Verrucomicrobia bacterium]|nr:NADH:ubiquinone reductase (Na(+)-transporting) subunit C [Verrucomicrobiota bacterium]